MNAWILSTVCLAFAVGLLLWYISKTLKKLLFVSDNIGELIVSVNKYMDILEYINSLEVYHGDDTIQGLMEETVTLLTEVEKFEGIYSLTTTVEEAEDEEEEADEQEEEEM
jgi:hypothetical protein